MIIYKIFYKDWKVFDISLFLDKSDVEPTKGKFSSDLHSYICPEGMAHFIFECVKTPEELETVIANFKAIDDLRVILWEDPDYDNSPLPIEQAEERENKIVRPEIERVLKTFCKVYKFGLITD